MLQELLGNTISLEALLPNLPPAVHTKEWSKLIFVFFKNVIKLILAVN
jgi:hypothetical protein